LALDPWDWLEGAVDAGDEVVGTTAGVLGVTALARVAPPELGVLWLAEPVWVCAPVPEYPARLWVSRLAFGRV
jgi:hypothetical protein